jgi:hypothetical protein
MMRLTISNRLAGNGHVDGIDAYLECVREVVKDCRNFVRERVGFLVCGIV